MISFLQGILRSWDAESLTIDVSGVGYEVLVSKRTLEHFSHVGSQVALHTHLHVREDAFILFGFETPAEKQLFARLLKVSGLGPKGALSILSQGSPGDLAHAVLTEQVEYFKQASGIGKKTSERLLIELRGVVEGFASSGTSGDASSLKQTTSHEEAIQALVQLGYSAKEAEHAVHSVPDNAKMKTEALVRSALQEVTAPVN